MKELLPLLYLLNKLWQLQFRRFVVGKTNEVRKILPTDCSWIKFLAFYSTQFRQNYVCYWSYWICYFLCFRAISIDYTTSILSAHLHKALNGLLYITAETVDLEIPICKFFAVNLLPIRFCLYSLSTSESKSYSKSGIYTSELSTKEGEIQKEFSNTFKDSQRLNAKWDWKKIPTQSRLCKTTDYKAHIFHSSQE